MDGQQTFHDEHWAHVTRAFGGNLDIETLGILYRASHSTTFSADLRALMREIVQPPVVEEWEAGQDIPGVTSCGSCTEADPARCECFGPVMEAVVGALSDRSGLTQTEVRSRILDQHEGNMAVAEDAAWDFLGPAIDGIQDACEIPYSKENDNGSD